MVRRLLPECSVRFVLSDSGSSKGAALVTAVAQRLAARRRQVRMLCVCFCTLYEWTHFILINAFISDVKQNFLRVSQVDETLSPFRLSQETLQLVKTRMRSGLEAGLKTKGSSAIKMLPSFVYRTPDGTGQRMKYTMNKSCFF